MGYLMIVAVFLLIWVGRKILIRQVEKSTLEHSPEQEEFIEQALQKGIERIPILVGKEQIYAHWFKNEKAKASIFIVHGNGESLSDWYKTQTLLNDLGYSSFVFDFNGFGSSEGISSVKSLRRSTRSAWKCFNEIYEYDSKKIVVAHSLGVAVLLDVVDDLLPKPSKIILHGAFSSARDIAIHMGSLQPGLKYLIPDMWNNVKNISHINSIETHIFHSKSDKKIPYNMGKKIAEASKSTIFDSLEESEHSAIYEHVKVDFWKTLLHD